MHNYQSNQSALMIRCGTDFRHQYGIFGGESQMSFTRNATRAGSEEGRLFSQASSVFELIFLNVLFMFARIFFICSVFSLLKRCPLWATVISFLYRHIKILRNSTGNKTQLMVQVTFSFNRHISYYVSQCPGDHCCL